MTTNAVNLDAVAMDLATSILAGISHMKTTGIPSADFIVADLRRADNNIWEHIESWEEAHEW